MSASITHVSIEQPFAYPRYNPTIEYKLARGWATHLLVVKEATVQAHPVHNDDAPRGK